MTRAVDAVIAPILASRLNDIAKFFGKNFDAIGIISDLIPGVESALRNAIDAKQAGDRAVIVLATSGGVAEVVERMVRVIRNFYGEVFFVIPDQAMSAGTIFAMSGDKIYMDYYSCMGPIDPQMIKDGKPLSVAGYLRQFEDLKNKSNSEHISPVEFALLDKLDLGELESYADAQELAQDLLVDWLSRYKFKDWEVSKEQKQERAKEIASRLGDNRRWHSHGRAIGIGELREMRLKIEDFGETPELSRTIKEYFSLATDSMRQFGINRIVQMGDLFA